MKEADLAPKLRKVELPYYFEDQYKVDPVRMQNQADLLKQTYQP